MPLTTAEARRLSAALVTAADEIDGNHPQGEPRLVGRRTDLDSPRGGPTGHSVLKQRVAQIPQWSRE